MILFPSWLFSLIIYVGIVLAAAGGIFLLVLLARDIARRSIW